MYNYKIIGHPIGLCKKKCENKFFLANSKYSREVYMFNMCFIVPQDSQNDSIYEPVVQKFASYLVDLENVRKNVGFFRFFRKVNFYHPTGKASCCRY